MVDEIWVVGLRVVEAHHELASRFEIAGYDIDVVDFVGAEEESQADVPVGLFAGAEDGYIVDGMALFEKHGRGQSCAESGDFFGVDKAGGVS